MLYSSSNSERAVLHLDLDTFFVSVERLMEPSLCNRPVLVGGGERGVVAACSYEARYFGIHSAMPMKLARRLCPEAVVLRGDMEAYSRYSHLVTDIIAEQAPVYEKASIDEFYLDLTGMDRYFGCLKWSKELRAKIISETGLPVSFGLSVNKMVSKVATGEAKPNGQLQIPYGEEQQFLDPLPVTKIPMIGLKTGQTLRNMGVQQIATLRQMPQEMLEALFGKNGREIWRRAHGLDDSPVQSFSAEKSISAERTFQEDTIDIIWLRAMVISMTEKLAFRLRSENKLTACVSVRIRYSDFETVSRQAQVSYTAADHSLIPLALQLFEKLYQRRLLIRMVGVRFSNLVHGRHQINLFEDTEERINLCLAMDKIRRKFGAGSIMRATGMGLNNH